MVKVVGKDTAAIKRKTCKNCASVLEYTPSELKNFRHTDYGGDTEIVHYISCPTCHKKVEVKP